MFTGSSSQCFTNRQRDGIQFYVYFDQRSCYKYPKQHIYYPISAHDHSTEYDSRYKRGQWLS